jgi:L-threonylcarbamoyladenylate synthase
MRKYWPGPLTLILPRGKNIPDLVTSGEPTVGVRIPAHPLFQEVLMGLPFPLAAPSANRFGRISPTEAFHVETELEGRISAILDGGACEVGVESTILRIEDPFRATLLRPGKIGASELEIELKSPIGVARASGQENQAQIAPGLLDQHYAPRKPLFLIPEIVSTPEQLSAWALTSGLTGKYGFLSQCSPYTAFESGPAALTLTLSLKNDPHEIARSLFSYLRSLDEYSEIDFILADVHPHAESGLLAAIADRLNRASLNKPLKPSR